MDEKSLYSWKIWIPDYLYSSDLFLMKIYIKNLSFDNEEKEYITLIIHRDGTYSNSN